MAWSTPATRGQGSALLRRLLHWPGVARAVAFGILKRIWSLAAGPAIMLLIASRSRRELQGYYCPFLPLGTVILYRRRAAWHAATAGEQAAVEV